MSLMFEFDTFMSEKIKPNFGKARLKDIEEVHYRLSKFLKKWINKNNGQEAPMEVEQALFELSESINVLKLVEHMGDGIDFTKENLTAYWTGIMTMLDYEIDDLNRILEDLANHYPDTKQKYINAEGGQP